MQEPGRVVGKAEVGRSDGERRRLVRDDEVAAEDEVEGAAPDGAVHHGDDGQREAANGAHALLERIVVAEGIAATAGQLVDVVPGRPDRGALRRPDDDSAHVAPGEGLERRNDLAGEEGAEGVALVVVLQRDDAHAAPDLRADEGR